MLKLMLTIIKCGESIALHVVVFFFILIKNMSFESVCCEVNIYKDLIHSISVIALNTLHLRQLNK